VIISRRIYSAVGNLKRIDQLEDLWILTLTLLLDALNWKIWTGFRWLMIGIHGGMFIHDNDLRLQYMAADS
jgi:hypothetical protein